MTRTLTSLLFCLALPGLAACPRPDEEVVLAPDAPATDPQLVEMSAAISRPTLRADEVEQFFARVRVSGKEFSGAAKPRVNLALALDASGSMQGEALAESKAAALTMLEQLEDGSRLSIVAFGGKTEVLVGSQVLDPSSRAMAREAIETMEAKGTTDMAGGLSTALGLVTGALDPEGINRVVLLSDGVPNETAGIDAIAEQARNSGVSITSLGLGLEFDETLLTMISQRSGGRYHYLEEPDQVVAVFEEELLDLERAVARSSSLALRAGPGVQIVEIVGFPGAAQGNWAQVHLGDIGDDQTRDVFVRLQVQPHVDGARVELFDATLTFQDVAVNAGSLQREAYLSTTVGAEVDEGMQSQASEIAGAAERMVAAAAIVEVVALARGGQTAQAIARLDEAERIAEAAKGQFPTAGIGELLEEMQALRESWPTQSTALVVETPPTPAVGPGYPGGTPPSGADMSGMSGMADMPTPAPTAEYAPPPPPRSGKGSRRMRRSHAKALEVIQ